MNLTFVRKGVPTIAPVGILLDFLVLTTLLNAICQPSKLIHLC